MPTMNNSVFYNNSPQEFYVNDPEGDVMGAFDISYCNFQGGPGAVLVDGITEQTMYPTFGPGNLYVDPLFLDASNGDFHLTQDSRLIDAGHPDSVDADGTIADIGAFLLRSVRNAHTNQRCCYHPKWCQYWIKLDPCRGKQFWLLQNISILKR